MVLVIVIHTLNGQEWQQNTLTELSLQTIV